MTFLLLQNSLYPFFMPLNRCVPSRQRMKNSWMDINFENVCRCIYTQNLNNSPLFIPFLMSATKYYEKYSKCFWFFTLLMINFNEKYLSVTFSRVKIVIIILLTRAFRASTDEPRMAINEPTGARKNRKMLNSSNLWSLNVKDLIIMIHYLN